MQAVSYKVIHKRKVERVAQLYLCVDSSSKYQLLYILVTVIVHWSLMMLFIKGVLQLRTVQQHRTFLRKSDRCSVWRKPLTKSVTYSIRS